MDANLRVLSNRSKQSPALPRYDEIACLLTGKASAKAEEGIEWVQALSSDLSIRRLSSFGIAERDLPVIAAEAKKASSMRGNPVELTLDELAGILRAAL
jgi:alcohol dehydrogenase class IV